MYAQLVPNVLTCIVVFTNTHTRHTHDAIIYAFRLAEQKKYGDLLALFLVRYLPWRWSLSGQCRKCASLRRDYNNLTCCWRGATATTAATTTTRRRLTQLSVCACDCVWVCLPFPDFINSAAATNTRRFMLHLRVGVYTHPDADRRRRRLRRRCAGIINDADIPLIHFLLYIYDRHPKNVGLKALQTVEAPYLHDWIKLKRLTLSLRGPVNTIN